MYLQVTRLTDCFIALGPCSNSHEFVSIRRALTRDNYPLSITKQHTSDCMAHLPFRYTPERTSCAYVNINRSATRISLVESEMNLINWCSPELH